MPSLRRGRHAPQGGDSGHHHPLDGHHGRRVGGGNVLLPGRSTLGLRGNPGNHSRDAGVDRHHLDGHARTWSAVTNATGYAIYGRVAGVERMIARTTLLTWTDDGSIAPSTTPPQTVSTARLYNSTIALDSATSTDASWAVWLEPATAGAKDPSTTGRPFWPGRR